MYQTNGESMRFPKTYIDRRCWAILFLAAVASFCSLWLLLATLEMKLGLAVGAAFHVFLLLFVGLYLRGRWESQKIYDRSVRFNYKQTEALFNLFSMYRFQYPLPEMRHWAVSPDALLHLVRETIRRRAKVILECGSGVSTVVLAKCISELDGGHVYSMDHDPKYANQTRELLRLHGLSEYATVIDAPLEPVNAADGKTYQWYSLAPLQDLPSEIELVFVDGPPAPIGTFGRLPALEMLRSQLKSDCTIVMDDVIRPDEARIAELWSQELGRGPATILDVEKKMAII